MSEQHDRETELGEMRRFRVPFLIVLLGLMIEREAKAYTDPGSGILLWQVIVSALVAGLFYVRRIVNWVRRRISRAT